jgi:hypothetical protein
MRFKVIYIALDEVGPSSSIPVLVTPGFGLGPNGTGLNVIHVGLDEVGPRHGVPVLVALGVRFKVVDVRLDEVGPRRCVPVVLWSAGSNRVGCGCGEGGGVRYGPWCISGRMGIDSRTAAPRTMAACENAARTKEVFIITTVGV